MDRGVPVPARLSMGVEPEGAARIAGPRGSIARLWQCTGCGYDLGGLPAAGPCPECGALREEGWLWIAGWSRAKEIPYGRTHAIRVVLGSLLVAAFFCAPILIFRRAPVLSAGTLGLLLAVCLPVFGLVALMVRRERRRPPPLTAHLTLDGLTLKTRRLKDWGARWEQVRDAGLRRIGRGLYRVRITYGASAQTLARHPQRAFGLAEFTMVFRGTPRDAALVRRTIRRRMPPGSAWSHRA